MSPASTSSNESVSQFPAGRADRQRLNVRGLTELLAELVGADASDVIVLAIVPTDRRPPAPERGHRPEPRQRIHRPVGLSSAKERQPADAAWASLTERERAVALLAGHALTNQQIAHRLKISPHTVNFHLRQVFKKLSIESRVSLARIVQTRPSVVETTGAR
ncbi:hypothetical protein GCM10022251_41900 [Phytohabitans flavus]|uniref:HTH luxR-type domain-containing protein n=1 Tax=Phytohabitans flavus TaxID=1076124 RepID=A0A6F8Y0D8_9ACTN|nr:hypothetical protein Pflav_059740 [Phytohabitans flavus]